jgi:predicted N-acetyltransferase YhbS
VNVSVAEQHLLDGLLLRAATPQDLDQIGALLVERGESADALDHRLVMEDPDAGWESCAVVADADRLVSTATLLDEELRAGSVVLPAGQVELVATAKGYEGRGLVRALMAWAHRRSAERGHVVQVMVGIPYFYRLFGYEYAIDIAQPRRVDSVTHPGRSDNPGSTGPKLRPASPQDVAALCNLQRAAQATADVAMPHPPARTRWLVHHESSTIWVLDRDAEVVASARVPVDDPQADLLATEVAAADQRAAQELLSRLQESAGTGQLSVVDRPGTITDQAWSAQLRPAESEEAHQYYVRIPDAAMLIDQLRPVLNRRLTRLSAQDLPTGFDGVPAVVLSTFGRHYQLPIGNDGLGPVITGGPLQAPGAVGGAGVAPDALGALLLGQRGIAGLARQRPDVYPGPNRALFEALFPAQTADLLTYYLPY